MFALFIVLFVLVAVAAIVFAILQYRREKARAAAIEALAQENGWSYTGRDSRDRVERYRGFTPFGTGHSRYAYNIVTGRSDDALFEVFDYHYAQTTGSGKNRRTQHYHHQVATILMPLFSPGLSIQPERFHHKVLGKLGGGDINFESDEFSRRFWVRSPERRFAYDVIHTGMMEFLLTEPAWHWQWQGDTLLLHRTGRLRAEDVVALRELAMRFRGLLPRHLLADRSREAAWRRVTP